MRREIYPLARRLATRLTQERHARRRGPLDFRRTVRASMSTGGVPLTTHHRPKRPHRTELVVLCDVSGSVASFAQFTLLLVFALRDQFTRVRAFTFVDQVHEVTHHFRPGADVADVMAELAASTAHAALWGRTNYGRAFTELRRAVRRRARAPKSSLLILGDARSNYSDLSVPVLRRAGRIGPARLVAQPRAPPALGHRRLRGRRRTARSCRWSSAATSPSSGSSCTTWCEPGQRTRVIWNAWLRAGPTPVRNPSARSRSSWSTSDGSRDWSTPAAPAM